MSNRRDFIKDVSLAGAGLLFVNSFFNSAYAYQPAFDADSPVMRFRQVHLDFHTSEKIEDVARDFDPEEFAATLKKAYVNSVTAFARCHHGYLYYDSKKHPERIHPFLTDKNLLKKQIEACHKQNIRVPIYTTIQWDYYTAQRHPEWLVRDENGAPIAFGNTNVFQPGFYNHLDIATPYIDFLKDHLRDLFEAVPVDGLFLDIHHIMPNANQTAIEGMLKKGLDPTKEQVRLLHNQEVTREYKEDLTAFIRKLDKNCTIFYNSGHVGPHIKETIPYNTHLELESLPSGGWGYMHFPLTVRYARNLGKDVMGMTGKFHTSWGDFHSLKNEAALEYETSMMIAMNAKCSIGDQLHPKGRLDKATYDLIGKAYKKVAEKE
ncbi:MAG TPA: alpha-L-fucosidase, partial [Chitinophagaceae bacterium]|nr:alpha-L-fucosidase [Chitinophagaceae bacterium]